MRTSLLRAGQRRAALTAALLAATLAGSAWAQYKVVGPDGRVTYTDRPPSDATARITPIRRDGIVEAAAPDALPSDLRQVATRYPVTLYVVADCPACEEGKQLLQQRGIPFTEKRVVSEEDAVALQARFGARTVPALSIGAQALRGLSPDEWNAYLDAAGYPRESRLPKGWRPAEEPAKGTAVARAPAAADSASAAASAPPALAPAPVTPPPGIRF